MYTIKLTIDEYIQEFPFETFRESLKWAAQMYAVFVKFGNYADDIDIKIKYGYCMLWWTSDKTRTCEIFLN